MNLPLNDMPDMIHKGLFDTLEEKYGDYTLYEIRYYHQHGYFMNRKIFFFMRFLRNTYHLMIDFPILFIDIILLLISIILIITIIT